MKKVRGIVIVALIAGVLFVPARVFPEPSAEQITQTPTSLLYNLKNLDQESIDLLLELGKKEGAALAYEKKGDVLEEAGDRKGAIELYSKALDLRPEDEVLKAKISEALYKISLPKKAAIGGASLVVLAILGYILIGKVLFMQAFRKGKSYVKEGNQENALRELGGASSLVRKATEQFKDLVKVCVDSDLFGRGAEEIYRKALNLGLSDVGRMPLKTCLAKAMVSSGRSDSEAMSLYEEVLKSSQDSEILRFVADQEYKSSMNP